MMFVLHFDGPYMKWARIFIKTIEVFEPESKIYINGINLHKKMIYELRNCKNIVDINNRKVRREKVITDRSKGGGWMAQIISMRASMFLDAINKYPEEDIYITCDVDMLLINNLDILRKNMENNDLGLCIFPEIKRGIPLKRNKVMAGFICARKTEEAMRYLKLWNKLSKGRYTKKIDQIALVNAYEKLKEHLNIYILSRAYLDVNVDANSYVLSAHKSRAGGKNLKYKLFKHFADNIKDEDMKSLIIKMDRWLAEWRKREYIARLKNVDTK